MYYNAVKKTLSRLKEALTRALNTRRMTRDAAKFLSSAPNYFARRKISSRVFCRCKKPLQNAHFLHVRRMHDEARFVRTAARSDVPHDIGIASEFQKTACGKLFWIRSRNRLVIDPTVIGIARIGIASRFASASIARPR
jgi:hypothetical protein